MPIEIERKFLVKEELLPKNLPQGDELEQGYLSTDPTVRIRLVARPDGTRHAELTIKGKGLIARPEFNYPVPIDDAEALLRLCKRSLRKVRRKLHAWDLDHFPARNLWLAEIELSSEDQPFERPDWLGQEVTTNPEYSNSRLATPTSGE